MGDGFKGLGVSRFEICERPGRFVIRVCELGCLFVCVAEVLPNSEVPRVQGLG